MSTEARDEYRLKAMGAKHCGFHKDDLEDMKDLWEQLSEGDKEYLATKGVQPIFYFKKKLPCRFCGQCGKHTCSGSKR